MPALKIKTVDFLEDYFSGVEKLGSEHNSGG
jgi:hypothetical protein